MNFLAKHWVAILALLIIAGLVWYWQKNKPENATVTTPAGKLALPGSVVEATNGNTGIAGPDVVEAAA